MSYADARRPRLPALVASIALEGAIGYAVIAGLTYSYTHHPRPTDLTLQTLHEPPPPPPIVEPQPQPKTETHVTLATPPVVAPKPIVETPPVPAQLATSDLPAEPHPVFTAAPAPEASASPAPMLAHGAAAIGRPGAWFPNDAYPTSARLANAQGRVSVLLGIGANGRVTDCQVTASSGNADLDAATCRLAQRNGRFKPATDEAGNPIASTTPLRNVLWRIED